jgi:NAD(P)-dependent dehydrogenase (short-subunit alcohol dehydrogenase family)
MIPLTDLISLQGRSAVITGGARGLGFAIAQRFAEAGASLLLADLNEAAAEEAAARLADERGVRALGAGADLRDSAQVEAVADRAVAELGAIDVWVNNAGVFPRSPGVQMSDDEWNFVLDLNLRAAFFGCRAAGRRMVERGAGGVILNMASTAGHRGYGPGLAHYVSSKHGVRGLTKSFAVELGPHGIRVMSLSPSSFPTEGLAEARAEIGAEVTTNEAPDFHPLAGERIPDQLARVALFCASDLAEMCTGSDIAVDAGVLAAGLQDRRYD